MSAMVDAMGGLLQISRQCATSCDTRTHAGVAKFRREGQGRWLGCIGQFEASRSVTEQDSNTWSPRGFDCIECAGLRWVLWLFSMRVRAWKIMKQPCATRRTCENPNVFEGF